MTESESSPPDPGTSGNFRSGFVAIIGAPNVGKSTLLNALLGEKVAITTPKPQTTRRQIRGILTGDNFQIVFVDTPGIHQSKRLLNKKIVETALNALKDVDIVLFVVDVTSRKRGQEFAILDILRDVGAPVILLLNKVDMVPKGELLPMIDSFRKIFPFEAIIPISAKYGSGIDRVLDEILSLLPRGPQYYDRTTTSDQRLEEMAAELIREKIFLLAEQEIPYSTAVEVEEVKEIPEKNLLHIRAVIYVERSSQKGIIIGKGGKFIKKVGKLTREELEKALHKKVFLDLWVKVLKDWSKDERALKRLGLST